MENDLSVKLRKNKIDLKHKVLLQYQQIILAFGLGFPLTAINVAISLNLLSNRDLMLIVMVVIVTCLAVMGSLIERCAKKIRETQNEIDQLLQEVQHEN